MFSSQVVSTSIFPRLPHFTPVRWLDLRALGSRRKPSEERSLFRSGMRKQTEQGHGKTRNHCMEAGLLNRLIELLVDFNFAHLDLDTENYRQIGISCQKSNIKKCAYIFAKLQTYSYIYISLQFPGEMNTRNSKKKKHQQLLLLFT